MNVRRHLSRFAFAPNFVLVAAFLGAAMVASPALARTSDSPASPPAGPEITYTKVFKASYPEFTEIKIDQSGAGTFDLRQMDEDANPQPFQVSPALARKVFDLAAKLHDFDGLDLDVHKRIANLGEKTFRYDNGSESHHVTFNYTLNDSAVALLSVLDGLARQEGDIANLQRTMRYDPLGVNDALAEIEKDVTDKVLPEPASLLPALDQVAANQRVITLARDRAHQLAARLRSAQ